MSQSTTVRRSGGPPVPTVRGSADVVAAVPYLLGFVPSAPSLVALSVRSSRRLGAAARVDVPPPADAPAVAGQLAEALTRDAAVAAVLVLYDDTEPGEEPSPAGEAALGDTAAALTAAGVAVVDLVHVGPTRWRSLCCPDPSCCDVDGFPVADTRTRPLAVGFVVSGRSPAAHRDELEPPAVRAGTQARRSASTAAGRWRRSVHTGIGATERFRLLDEWLTVLDDHRRDGALPGPTSVGRLAAAWTADRAIRDACMIAALPASRMAPDALLAGSRADVSAVLADASCAAAVEAAAPVLRCMAGHLSGAGAAAVLAVHAWLAWASGQGAAAGDLVDRALVEQPDHRLAILLRDMLDRAVGPQWATAPEAGSAAGREAG